MRRIPIILLALGVLYSCLGSNKQRAEKALEAYRQEIIAAAGIDTAALDDAGKLLLRQLLSGCQVVNTSGFLTYELKGGDYPAAQALLARSLEQAGYVPPTEERFHERLRLHFGLDLQQPQYIGYDQEQARWIPVAEPHPALGGARRHNWLVFVDPLRRYIDTDESGYSMRTLPRMVRYRDLYPQLDGVEQYIDREKLLSLTLDAMETPASSREYWSIELYGDPACETDAPAKLAAYNKFLVGDDAASFRLIFSDYFEQNRLLAILGSKLDLSQPGIETGRPLSDLLDFEADSAVVKRPYWKVFSRAQGDLNGDGLPDRVFGIGLDDELLYNTGEKNDDGPGEQMRSRFLVIALSDKEQPELRIHSVLCDLLPHYPAWDSSMDDPLDGLEIADGNLILRERSWMSAGSWWAATYTYRFEYDPARSQFLLVSYEAYSRHRATGEENTVEIDLKKGWKECRQYTEADPENGTPATVKSTTQYFAALPPVPIENIRRGATFRVSEETSDGQVSISMMD